MADDGERSYGPISTDDVPWTQWSDVPRFGIRYRHLSEAVLGPDYRIGVAIEELPPGMQAAPAHYHIFEEEHLYLLEGTLTLRLGDIRRTMRPGDYVCFPAGQKAGHCLINETDASCRYVIIGEKNPNDVIVYTDSKKVLIRALGHRALFDLEARRGYWDGENTGLLTDAPNAKNYNNADIGPDPAPKPPVSTKDVPLEHDDISPLFGGNVRRLTYAAVGNHRHLGVLIEMPDPGKRLAPLHYHLREEEHALVLEGELTLLLGDETCDEAGRLCRLPCRPEGRSLADEQWLRPMPLPDDRRHRSRRHLRLSAVGQDGGRRHRGPRQRFDMKARRRYWDGEA